MVLPKYIIYIHSLWILLNKMCKYECFGQEKNQCTQSIKKIQNDSYQLAQADLRKYSIIIVK